MANTQSARRGAAWALLVALSLLAFGCVSVPDADKIRNQLGRGTFRVKQGGKVLAWVSRTETVSATAEERWIFHDDFETVDADATLAERTLVFEHASYVEYTDWQPFHDWVVNVRAESMYDNKGLQVAGEIHDIVFELVP